MPVNRRRQWTTEGPSGRVGAAAVGIARFMDCMPPTARPQIVLTDLVMPGLGGAELGERILRLVRGTGMRLEKGLPPFATSLWCLMSPS